MAKKTNSEAFFAETYGPVLRKIEEREIKSGRYRNAKYRALNAARMRRYRAKKGSKLSPEALLEARRRNIAIATAKKTPEQRAIHATIARRARYKNMTPEKKRALREAGIAKLRAHNESVGVEGLRRQQQKSVMTRLKITADWPFPPPRLSSHMKKRLAEGRDVLIDPATHETWFAAHPESQFTKRLQKK